MRNKATSASIRPLCLAAIAFCALCLWTRTGHTTGQLPPPAPQSPSGDNPESRPKATPPDIPPPSRDPGIVKQPKTVPHPDSVVVPPVVDPGMAVNPEQAQGTKPNRPPARDNSPDNPAPRR